MKAMRLGEGLLFLAAKWLYPTKVCRNEEARKAESDIERYCDHRSGRIGLILDAAARYGVEIRGRTVLDFGCGDGAITRLYPLHGARMAIGVDVNAQLIQRASGKQSGDAVRFLCSAPDRIPLPDASVDTAVSYDVFEHLDHPPLVLGELYRVLRPGGKALIGTWGWYHPFAPHLFATMPVPWAHVFFSERTVMRTCRRVYTSPWYEPAYHDLDEHGELKPNKYLGEEIPTGYVNKLLIRDFEQIFRASPFHVRMHPQPFGSSWARWTWIFVRLPWLKEFVTGYLWAVLTKKRNSAV